MLSWDTGRGENCDLLDFKQKHNESRGMLNVKQLQGSFKQHT